MNKIEKFMKPRMTFGDALRFTPYAWGKLLWMRDRGPTEVAGYCVTRTEDPLLVTDFILIKQECTGYSFDLDPDDIIEYTDRMLDKGIPPWASNNILSHTHPGESPYPSQCDETNFKKAFSHPNWAIMFILADSGKTYCRMKINVGPGIIKEIDVVVDWKQPFSGSNIPEWEKEYKEKVTEKKWSKFEFASSKKQMHTKSATIISDAEVDLWIENHQNDSSDNPWSQHQNVINQDFDDEQTELEVTDDLDCFWNYNGEVEFYINELWHSYDPIEGEWYVQEMDGTFVKFEPDDNPIYKQIVDWAVDNAGERLDAIMAAK